MAKRFTNIRNPTLKDRAGGKIGAKLKLGVLGSKAELTGFITMSSGILLNLGPLSLRERYPSI